jgi:hypothetical protein
VCDNINLYPAPLVLPGASRFDQLLTLTERLTLLSPSLSLHDTGTGADLIGWTFHERSLGYCKVLHTDTYLDSDSILWNTLTCSSSKAKDTVVSKVSKVRKWCKKGQAPTLNYSTLIINAPVSLAHQQQPEYTSHFRAILHPPKTLPPVSTHQYKTRLRRILSAFRIITHRNAKNQSSTLQPQPEYHPDPNSDPNPNPNSDPNPNPNSDSSYNHNPYPDILHETLPTILNLDSHGKPTILNLDAHGNPAPTATSDWLIAEAEEICQLILSGTLLPIHYAAIPYDRLGDVVYYNPVVKQKWNDDGTIKFCVRDTAGGNLLDKPYDVSARTASLDVVKMLLHSTMSDNKKWFTIDIKDFYLGTPLPETATTISGLSARDYPRPPLRPTIWNPCFTTTQYISKFGSACTSMDSLRLDA